MTTPGRGLTVSGLMRAPSFGPVIVVTLLLLLSACGSEPATLREGGVTVLVNDSERSGQDAGLDGEVTVEGGCAGVNDRVIVWPNGTSIEDTEPFVLDVPDQGQVGLGETVSLGGGSVEVDPADPVAAGLAVPLKCLNGAEEVFAAN